MARATVQERISIVGPIEGAIFVTSGICAKSATSQGRQIRQRIDLLVPVERIELPTFGLQNRCSTAELNRLTH